MGQGGFNTASGIGYILATVKAILNYLVPILVTIAVVYFIMGVTKYVTAKDADGQKEGRTMIISGIVGIFVITAIWGLVKVLGNTFLGGTSTAGPANNQLPCVGGVGC